MDVSQRILSTAPFELVDGYGIGKIQHVDLFQLRRRAELRRHDIQRYVRIRNNAGVTLTDTRSFHNHQIETTGATRGNGVRQIRRHFGCGLTSGQRTEEDAIPVDGVHPNTVAQQCPTTTATTGIDGQHRDTELVLLIQPETSNEFVGER